MKRDGNIPVLSARGRGLAEAWENAILLLYNEGCEIKTEYDKPEDPLSKDSTMIITIEEPSTEPKIHKCFPGGIDNLEEYRLEVVEGIKDSWIRNPTDIQDTKWEYTYHGRLCNRETPLTEIMKYLASLPEENKKELEQKGVKILLDMPWVKLKSRKVENKLEQVVVIDQLEACVNMLSRVPHTRRAQAITWQPEDDLVSYDPPCLQSFWFRMLKGNDGIYRLNMDIRIRSNDAYGASFMNMFGFASVQENIAQRVEEKIKEKIILGRYVHMADSFHIYGKDLKEIKERLINRINTTSFEERTYRSDDSEIKAIIREAVPRIYEKAKKQTERYKTEKR